ncbi:unnamed protein product [Zymoseptoria tritici ST99CH_1E4]|uniref:Heterokaryon incompatibility domain-containing protein n=1 Tax=Zymoseptoria tritici ST99CH_1E4 TaxID=1276532 RepID=A0A2H1H524_ZYMTR|nr:unnamed protein product [Zymoseptoria tritici ST99CH_1E4]
MSKIYESASRVVIWLGKDSTASSHAMTTLEYLGRQLRLPSDSLRQIVRRAEEIALNRNRKTLSLLLEVTKMSKCVDPRDRIYGLLGLLMKGELDMDFMPDYTKEVDEVYKIVFLKASSLTGRLDLLRHCEHGSWPQKEIPSWVPNWNAQDKANHIAAWLDAGRDLIRPIAWTPEGLLEVDTVNLGRIISTGDVILRPGVSPEERLRFTRQLGDMEPSIGDRSPYLTSGEDLLGVHISRLCWGSLQNKLMDYHVSSLEQYMKVYKAIFNSTSSESSTIINEPLVRQIEYWASGRRLFTTSQGHLGIGPAPMQVDDAVCVIRGCGAPMVLRPVMDETDIFTVVGEAYVHGMMDGEAILGPLPPSYTVRYRRLSDGHYQQHFFRSDSAGNEERTTDPRRSNVGRGSIAMSSACETTAILLA